MRLSTGPRPRSADDPPSGGRVRDAASGFFGSRERPGGAVGFIGVSEAGLSRVPSRERRPLVKRGSWLRQGPPGRSPIAGGPVHRPVCLDRVMHGAKHGLHHDADCCEVARRRLLPAVLDSSKKGNAKSGG